MLVLRQTLGTAHGNWKKGRLSVNKGDSRSENYAILDTLENFRSADGSFRLRMVHGTVEEVKIALEQLHGAGEPPQPTENVHARQQEQTRQQEQARQEEQAREQEQNSLSIVSGAAAALGDVEIELSSVSQPQYSAVPQELSPATPVKTRSSKAGKTALYTVWKSKSRLWGKHGSSNNICSNMAIKMYAGLPLTSCFFAMKAPPTDKGKKKDEMMKTYSIMSGCMSFFVGLWWFSFTASIELYMNVRALLASLPACHAPPPDSFPPPPQLNCGAGCSVFVWPDATDLVKADPRFDATHWANGTAMCYPVKGESAPDADYGTRMFKLGPGYAKPFPTNWANSQLTSPEYDTGARDPLYKWGIYQWSWGVIWESKDRHRVSDEDGGNFAAANFTDGVVPVLL